MVGEQRQRIVGLLDKADFAIEPCPAFVAECRADQPRGEHDEAFEQRPVRGQFAPCLDVRQGRPLEAAETVLGGTKGLEPVDNTGIGVHGHPHRHRIDQYADDIFRSRHRISTAGSRLAEDDILRVAVHGQQSRPRRQDEGIDGDGAIVGKRFQFCRSITRQV